MDKKASLKIIRDACIRSDFRDAGRLLAQFRQAYPDNADGLFLTGYIQYQQDDRLSARKSWNHALSLDPKHEEAQDWLAFLDQETTLNPADPVKPQPPELRENLILKRRLPNVWDLLFKPGKFYSQYAVHPNFFVILFCTWLTGLCLCITGMNWSAFHYDYVITKLADDYVFETWSNYWFWCFSFSFAIAATSYVLDASWFRFRLWLGGVKSPDVYLSRRVYFYSYMIVVLPCIAIAVLNVFLYSSPFDYLEYSSRSLRLFELVVLAALLFWAIYSGYIGIKSCFAVKKWRARIFFLFIPYLIAGLYVLVMYDDVRDYAEKPETENPQLAESEYYQFQYPSNWMIWNNKEYYDEDLDAYVEDEENEALVDISVQSSMYEASLYLTLDKGQKDIQDLLQDTINSPRWIGEKIKSRKEITKWGNFDGIGVEITYRSYGSTYTDVHFYTRINDRTFYVRSDCRSIYNEMMEPGMSLVRSTFTLKPEGV